MASRGAARFGRGSGNGTAVAASGVEEAAVATGLADWLVAGLTAPVAAAGFAAFFRFG